MEFLNQTDFRKARMIISTIPDMETNIMLTKKIGESNQKAIIILITHSMHEAVGLYKIGATYVVMPYYLESQHASTLIQKRGR